MLTLIVTREEKEVVSKCNTSCNSYSSIYSNEYANLSFENKLDKLHFYKLQRLTHSDS